MYAHIIGTSTFWSLCIVYAGVILTATWAPYRPVSIPIPLLRGLCIQVTTQYAVETRHVQTTNESIGIHHRHSAT